MPSSLIDLLPAPKPSPAKPQAARASAPPSRRSSSPAQSSSAAAKPSSRNEIDAEKPSFERTLKKASPKSKSSARPAQESAESNASDPAGLSKAEQTKSSPAAASGGEAEDGSPSATDQSPSASESHDATHDDAQTADDAASADGEIAAAMLMVAAPANSTTTAAPDDQEANVAARGSDKPVEQGRTQRTTAGAVSAAHGRARAVDPGANDDASPASDQEQPVLALVGGPGAIAGDESAEPTADASMASDLPAGAIDDSAETSRAAAATAAAHRQARLQADSPASDASSDQSQAEAAPLAAAPNVRLNGDGASEQPPEKSFDSNASAGDSKVTSTDTTGGKSAADAAAQRLEDFASALAQPASDAARAAPAPQSAAGGQQQMLSPEQRFADVNHPQIVTSVRQELLPNGGTMHIRLDPPELGALHVIVHLRDGMMTASFQTSNDQATRLLSHSLHQLKQSLEMQGVNIERMHVQQAPRSESDPNGAREDNGQSQHHQQSPAEQHSARQEQQRREMMQRLWRRLTGSDDYVDLVA